MRWLVRLLTHPLVRIEKVSIKYNCLMRWRLHLLGWHAVEARDLSHARATLEKEHGHDA